MPSLPGPTSTSVDPAGTPGSSSASLGRSWVVCSLPSRLDPAAPLVLGVPAGLAAAAPPAPGASTEARNLSA
eukprot:10995419-Alexandrium_andersonii.AAC.1